MPGSAISAKGRSRDACSVGQRSRGRLYDRARPLPGLREALRAALLNRDDA